MTEVRTHDFKQSFCPDYLIAKGVWKELDILENHFTKQFSFGALCFAGNLFTDHNLNKFITVYVKTGTIAAIVSFVTDEEASFFQAWESLVVRRQKMFPNKLFTCILNIYR